MVHETPPKKHSSYAYMKEDGRQKGGKENVEGVDIRVQGSEALPSK